MIIQDDSIRGRMCCEVENEMYFDADYVELEVDLWEFTGTLRHEIGGHSKTHWFEIERLDEAAESEDGYFIEGRTEGSGQEIIIDTGIGEYSVGGTSFDIDNNRFLTSEFEDPGVELGLSPDHYDFVLVDKRGPHYNTVHFDVVETEQSMTPAENLCTRIEGRTTDGDEITVEPEKGHYKVTEVRDYKTFGPDTQVVVGSTSDEKTWESSVDNSATEPQEPIGFATYDSSGDTVELACDYDTASVNTMTGEFVLSNEEIEKEFGTEITIGGFEDDDEPDTKEVGETQDMFEDDLKSIDDSESDEQAESSDESESEELDGEDVSFRDDVVYEPY